MTSDEKRVSDDRLREIIDGCKGVMPGPWSAEYDNSDSGEWYEVAGPRLSQGWNQGHDNQMKIDAEHIARLDPQTVAAICSELLARRSQQEPDGWRPIETAPRQPVAEGWSCGPDIYLRPTWGGWTVGRWVIDTTHEGGGWFEFLGEDGPQDEQPTHWQPLLAPTGIFAAAPQSTEGK